ncbi:hypothetical protein NQZ79_g6875 [Umbelopsis isabellina]|nr:hypothetical protein NQZ79_g6875 [Umbelopsis isabellina]
MQPLPHAREHRSKRIPTPHTALEEDPYRVKNSPDGSSKNRHRSDRSAAKEPKIRKNNYQELEDFGDDPYAIPSHRVKPPKEAKEPAGRAMSYLPYSHHPNDQYAPSNEPMYIEEDLQSLEYVENKKLDARHDSIAMEDVDYFPRDSRSVDQLTNMPKSNHLSLSLPAKRKQAKRKCCGIPRKVCVYSWFAFLIVVGVIWYFVWPRYPTLYLDGAALQTNPQWSNDSSVYSLQVAWSINFTADNNVNWVPTQIKNLHFLAYDPLTGANFGKADTGHMVMKARTQSTLTVPMHIAYNTTSTTDATFQNLYNACGPQKSGNASQQILRIAFSVTYYIAGFAWTEIGSVMPASEFACPT